MIGGLRKGNDFDGLIRYVLHGQGGRQPYRGRILGGTVLGADHAELAAVFSMIRLLRPDIDNPVRHVWVSASNGEHLSDEPWLWLGASLADLMGWDAWVAVQHQGACEHVHFIFSRIRWDGTVAREVLRDYRLIERVMREAEIRFGLTRVTSPDRPDRPHGRTQGPRMRGRERDMARNGKTSIKEQLRVAIQSAEAQGLRGTQLIKAVQAQGFQIETKWRDGRPSGVVWTHLASGRKISGSTLGPAFRASTFFRRIGAMGWRTPRMPRTQGWRQPGRPARLPNQQARESWEHRPARLGVAGSCSWLGRLLTRGWFALYHAAVGVALDPLGKPKTIRRCQHARGFFEPTRKSHPNPSRR